MLFCINFYTFILNFSIKQDCILKKYKSTLLKGSSYIKVQKLAEIFHNLSFFFHFICQNYMWSILRMVLKPAPGSARSRISLKIDTTMMDKKPIIFRNM